MVLFRVLQVTLRLVGISFLAWAYLDPRFRDAEGILDGRFCLPVAAGAALVILGFTVAGRLRKSALWFSLALVGNAVILQLIDAGSQLHYQHYKTLNFLLIETHPFLLIYLAMQILFVIFGIKNRWTDIRDWLGHTFKTWQLLGVGLFFLLSSATVSREIPIYMAELFFAAFVQAINLGNIVLMAWALPEDVLVSLKQRLGKLVGSLREADRRKLWNIDRYAVLAAVWVTLSALALGFFSYQWHPHIADEVGYLYHARYFSGGMLTMPAPPVQEAFEVDLMNYEKGVWFSPVPFGWPAMLAMGVLLGVPWLINPMLAGLNILLAYILIGEIYNRPTARIVVFLLCVSPWYIFMAMNLMPHTFTLTCALAAAVAVCKARRTNRALWAWLGGFSIGMVSLIRPLDGLIVAGLIGLWAIGLGGQRLKIPSIAGLALGAILIGSVALPYNNLLTGNPMIFPIMAYTDKYYGPKTNALGFGPERGLGWPIDPFPGHAPIDAIVNADLNISSINTELFGWSTGSLIMIALLMFSGAMRKEDYLMWSTVAAVVGAYSFYWFSGGPDFGARYWYLMLVPCVVLTVRGIQFLVKTFEAGSVGPSINGTRVMAAVLSLCLFALVNYFPWRAIDKYYHYLGMRPDIRYLAKEYDFGRSIVLIRGDRYPDYASTVIYNPLDLNANVPVYAWDRDSEIRAQVLRAYPDRSVWVVDGPSITERGYEIVDGPISASELIGEENLEPLGAKGKIDYSIGRS